jgi:hypothetical protein
VIQKLTDVIAFLSAVRSYEEPVVDFAFFDRDCLAGFVITEQSNRSKPAGNFLAADLGNGQKGVFASAVSDGKRKVFKFSLKPVENKAFGRVVELPHNRLIPTPVKVEVWRRDRGQCVQCGSSKNLHFDHDIPFSKGGSSLTAANVRLLCAKHNLENQIRLSRSRRGFS